MSVVRDGSDDLFDIIRLYKKHLSKIWLTQKESMGFFIVLFFVSLCEGLAAFSGSGEFLVDHPGRE